MTIAEDVYLNTSEGLSALIAAVVDEACHETVDTATVEFVLLSDEMIEN